MNTYAVTTLPQDARTGLRSRQVATLVALQSSMHLLNALAECIHEVTGSIDWRIFGPLRLTNLLRPFSSGREPQRNLRWLLALFEHAGVL